MIEIYSSFNIDVATKVIDFIDEKIKWMKQRGRPQWQYIDYTGNYNLDYFKESISNGDVLFVDYADDNSIRACLMLKMHGHYEELFPKRDNYVFLCHFVSTCNASAILRCVLEYCKSNNIHYIRGDVNNNVKGLTDYYTKLGAKLIDSGVDYDGYSYSLFEFEVERS